MSELKDLTDEELMMKVKEGDFEAFDLLYERYANPLMKFFYFLVWDQTTAEDYLHDVFLRLWRNAANYRPIGKFRTYIYQIAKNFYINQIPRLKRKAATLSFDQASRDGDSYTIDPPSNVEEPVKKVEREELSQVVDKAVMSLPEKLRMVFVLSQYETLNYKEVGKVLSIPVGTVKSRMAKAERLLRDKLRPYMKND